MNIKEKIDSNIQEFKSNDPMTYEDAYHYLSSILMECKSEIIDAYTSEQNPEIRGRFIEFLGLYKDESLITLFYCELKKEDESTVPWALSALIAIDTPKSRKIIYRFIEDNPQWKFVLPED